MSEPGDRPLTLILRKSGIKIEVSADQTILEALLAHGIDVDTVCREGICGTCETRVVSGTPDHRDDVLDEGERAAGDTMMVCVSRALTPTLELDL